MSTNGCIAMPSGLGWIGTYHHTDSYPTGLGRILGRLLQDRYKRDVPAAHKELILDNPAGWSSLLCFHPEWGDANVVDWDGSQSMTVAERHADPGILAPPSARLLPVSYKGDPNRADPKATEPPFTSCNPDPLCIEWVYILAPRGIRVLASIPCTITEEGVIVYDHSGPYRYVEAAFLHYDQPEPDWTTIEAKKFGRPLKAA